MIRTSRAAAIAVATIAVAACAVPAPAPAPRPATPAPLVNLGQSIDARLLSAHNRERQAVGVPPLQWDQQLARDAAIYARQLAATGRFQHATPDLLRGQGENLWMGTRGFYTPEAMVADWASGRRHFTPGTFPNVSRTGNWVDVGHYTQIIWPQTHSVGCAIASSTGSDYLVCRYLQPGNVAGVRVP